MWPLLLGIALLVTLHPVRLGVILLVVSRPRPVQNLLTYWLGCMILSVTYLLVPLTALHVTPTFASFTKSLATPGTVANSTARHIEFGMGVVALSIAALMAVRFSARQRAHLPTPGANTSTLVPDSNTPTAISRLLGSPATSGGGRHRAQKPPTAGGSAIRRLLGRTRDAWENGSLWVSLVISIAMSPTLDAVLLIVAIIVASGAALGTQVSAAIAFVVGMLAVEEIVLASYLVTPTKTHAVVQLLHYWARAHRRKVLVAIFAVGGVSLVAYGMG